MTERAATPTMTRRAGPLFAACVLVMGFASSARAQQSPGPPACPPGFPLTMTLDHALVRYAGYYTEEFIRTGFALHDINGNGYWCYKINPPDDRHFPLVMFFSQDDLEDSGPR